MNDTQAVQLLRDMLGIESLSGAEGLHADFLTRQMIAFGYTKACVDEAGNAVGEMGDPAAAVTIVLLGHQDTVPGRIAVRMEDGRLFGRGAVDAKGPLAAFTAAVARIGPRAGVRFVVIGATEEEAASSKGARHIRDRFLAEGIPSACLIGEPSGWERVTLGYKGRLLADLHVAGPCGHSAGNRLGVNEQAVHWWQGVIGYTKNYNQEREGPFRQLLPSLRSMASGSDGLSEWADLRVGLRLPPETDIPGLERDLTDLAQGVSAEPAACSLGFSGQERAWVADKNSPLTRSLVAGIRREGGRPGYLLKTGTSDMNVVAPAWNCPIAAYGPGDASLDHTPEEHIVIEEYLRAIRVLERVLAEI
ncbi:MAG: [LysW]-lysine hydrolase [Anaerolineae bacterium]